MALLPAHPQPTRDAIFAYYESQQDDGYREHLGASLIGTECERALWYTHRWATRANHSGRLLRLFERGQLEEDRFEKALRAIGATVMTVDPDTGRQWRCRDETGHFGGSADGVATGLPEALKTWAGLEMKTHSAKSFADLTKKGVKEAKPLHYAQMTIYGHLLGLERFLYLAVNKDNDDLYTEWVHIDPLEGIKLIAKARRIIDAPQPLTRIAHTETWFSCKFCDHHAACWKGALPERHCRSCLHSTPVADGQWHCAKHDKHLTLSEQKVGCPGHRYIPGLVSGEQIDGAEDGSWIEYNVGGMVWRDVGK